VKSSRSDQAIPRPAPDFELSRPGIIRSWTTFWFTPVPTVGLHSLRFLFGWLSILWLLTFAGNPRAFLGLSGWVDREVFVQASEPEIRDSLPDYYQPGWSVLYLFGTNSNLLLVVYWATLVLFIAFLLGFWTRLTSLLTWMMVVSFIANPVTRLDAEPLLGVLAFYLMVGYLLLGQWRRHVSWPERILGSSRTFLFGRGEEAPSVAANLAIRLLQVHFAIVVVTSGLHKLQSGDWWAGVAFWYPLHPPFETTQESLFAERAHANQQLFFLSLAQYIFLAWELGFPLFAWRKSWRLVLLGGALIGWIGCLAIYKQPLFGPIYCICALSYLTPTEWLAISDKLRLAQSWIFARNGSARTRYGSRVS